jgi:16S rRNA (uracil1498-N3)-methyltransferase
VKHFILTAEPDKNGLVRLSGDNYRYLVRVRRLAVGEYFPVLLHDVETFVQVISVDRSVLTGKCGVVPGNHSQPPSLPPIILFQALPKGEKMDMIVRQAAEGGISEIVPFISEFSVAKKAGREKFARWERIIKEARQQSGSTIATTVNQPLQMIDMFEYWNNIKKNDSLGLIFHHQDIDQTNLHEYLYNNPGLVVLAVGPEGGFSDTEVTRFLETGFKPVTIGDTVLRTETAALYAAAAIRVLLLERNSWELKKNSV